MRLFGPSVLPVVFVRLVRSAVWLMAWAAWPGSCVAVVGVWQVPRVWLVGRVWVVRRLCLEGHVGFAGSVCDWQGLCVAGQAGVWVVARVWLVGHVWLAWPVCGWLALRRWSAMCGRRARCDRSAILCNWAHCG